MQDSFDFRPKMCIACDNKHNKVWKYFTSQKYSQLCGLFDVKSIVYNPDTGVRVHLIQMLSLNLNFRFL